MQTDPASDVQLANFSETAIARSPFAVRTCAGNCESRNLLPLLLAQVTVLVRFDSPDGDTDKIRVSHAPEGIQAGESQHRAPHASLPRVERDSGRHRLRRSRDGASVDC